MASRSRRRLQLLHKSPLVVLTSLLVISSSYCIGFCFAATPPDPSSGLKNLKTQFHSFKEATGQDGLETLESLMISDPGEFAGRLDSACKYVSLGCQDDCWAYAKSISQLVNKKNFAIPFWALKMFDATGKIPDGITAGNFNALGSYTSCLELDGSRMTVLGEHKFIGKYATANVPLNNPPTLWATFGMCLPSTCQKEDFALVFYNTRNLTSYVGPTQTRDDTFVWDSLSYAFAIFVSLIAIVSVFATVADFWYQCVDKSYKDLKTWEKFLVSFSVYSNTAKLFAITEPSRDHLSCLDGIRFLSITWVMLGHWFSQMSSVFKINNMSALIDMTFKNFWFQAIDNAFVSVDTFFTISACLVSYLTLKELDKNRSINVPLFYIHRYLRLTGVYAFCIFFQATLVGAFNYGPTANPEMQTSGCREYYYRNLGYFQIYDYKEDASDLMKCLGQSWYLDNDMQMFIFSIFLIYPLWRLHKIGLPVTVIMAIGSAIVPAVLTHENDWPASPTIDNGNANKYFLDNYIKPWCRASPYLIGILLGYILHVTKNRQFKIPRLVNVLLWALAFGVGLAVVYGLNLPIRMLEHTDPDWKPLSQAATIAYGGFHRIAWAMAVAWVIFACCRGYGGWVNELLSWEAFQPLSKVSYVMYLTHFTIFQLIAASMTFEVTYSHLTAVIYFLASLVITVLVSGIIFVGVELPWLSVEKLAVGWIQSKCRPTRPSKPTIAHAVNDNNRDIEN